MELSAAGFMTSHLPSASTITIPSDMLAITVSVLSFSFSMTFFSFQAIRGLFTFLFKLSLTCSYDYLEHAPLCLSFVFTTFLIMATPLNQGNDHWISDMTAWAISDLFV